MKEYARGLEGAGHEIDRHKSIIDSLSDCKVVISHGMGRRIYDDLKKAGFEVFITEETQVSKALDLFLKGKLVDKPELECSHSKKCKN